MEPPSELLSGVQQQKIKDAIHAAEKQTSGEIRLCIEKKCKGDVLDRAAFIFKKTGMHNTQHRNGILFYVSTSDRKFAVIGDAGIHAIVKQEFWDKLHDEIITFFKNNTLADGIIHGIKAAGKSLAEYFPRKRDDKNELSDKIYFGDEK